MNRFNGDILVGQGAGMIMAALVMMYSPEGGVFMVLTAASVVIGLGFWARRAAKG